MEQMTMAKSIIWRQPAIERAQDYPCSLNNLAVGLPHPTGG
ncbi:MAG TPA: hypothetical protein VGF38_04440 [Ktedonobacterales bacterium]